MVLAKSVPAFTTVDVENLAEEPANMSEDGSNAHYFVNVMVDASKTMYYKE